MPSVEFKLRRAALGEIARSRAVGADLDRRARAVADRAGSGYLAVEGDEARRDRAAVIAATREARYDNAVNGTLLQAFDAARD